MIIEICDAKQGTDQEWIAMDQQKTADCQSSHQKIEFPRPLKMQNSLKYDQSSQYTIAHTSFS
jgi:hypothetical protein